MSLKTIVERSISKFDPKDPEQDLAELIAIDLAEYLRPELMRLLVSMVPMEHMDSFIDDRIDHLLDTD